MTAQPDSSPAPSDSGGILRRFGLLLAGVTVLVAISVLGIAGQPTRNCRVAMASGDIDTYWPGPGLPPSCTESSGAMPGIVTAVILIGLFAVLLVVHLVPLSRVRMLTLIVGGLMVVTFAVGLVVTIDTADAETVIMYETEIY